jgi:hypothetical protein
MSAATRTRSASDTVDAAGSITPRYQCGALPSAGVMHSTYSSAASQNAETVPAVPMLWRNTDVIGAVSRR